MSDYDLTPSLTRGTLRRVPQTRQGMLNITEHLIPLLFCEGVRRIQAFALLCFVLSLILFQICFVSLDYLIISHMYIFHLTRL